MIQKVALTSLDRAKLKADLPGTVIGGLILLSFIAGVVVVVLNAPSLGFGLLFSIPLPFLIYYSYLVIYLSVMDYTCGYKLLISGIVEKKHALVRSTGGIRTEGGSYAGGKLTSSSSSGSGEDKVSYRAWISGHRVILSRREYDDLRLGETCAIYVFPYSRFSVGE